MEELTKIGSILQKQRSFEDQTSYLRFGGTFQLRAHNKSRVHVGVNIERSPTFGGRAMGLYKDHRSHRGFETDYSSPRSKVKDSIKPLYLCASLPCTNDPEREILNDYDTNGEHTRSQHYRYL